MRYFGDYEIIRELARGGMGVVFEARQVSLNRKVALKMILAGQLADDTDIKRFYTEAEAAANLDHPGIVPIFEVGQHEGQHYFSMGFVEGKSLSQRLTEGPLPARQAAELMRRVSESIEFAHQRGVIHRDLKPANILLDQNGNPRVTDFGLAKKVQGDSGLTGSGQIMGTPSFMPPEQAGGKRGDVGPASDVYALGATLYALVTGRPPFQAATAMDTVLQVISDEPVPPRRLNATIPRDIETVCLKCLEKEPGKRYASAAALEEDLRRFLAGEPVTARPVGALERTWRWCNRNPKLAAALSAAVAGLFSVVGLSSLLGVREYKSAQELRKEKSQTETALRTVEEQHNDAQARLYVFNMREVERAWDEGKIGLFWEKLGRYGPGSPLENLRGFEWYYWQKRAEGRARLTGFTADVVGLGIDARRAEVLTVEADGRVSAHPLSGGATRDLFRLEAGTKVTGAVFDQALARVALGLSGGRIQIRDRATGQSLRTIETGGELTGTLRFSPDGKMLAASSMKPKDYLSDGISVWELRSGRRVFERPKTPGFMAFSPDGQTIAFSGLLDRGLKLIDLASGRESDPFGADPGFAGGMPAFCAGGNNVVQGGAMIAADGTSGGRLMLWKVADRSVLATRDKLSWNPSFLIPSPDGQQLAIAGLMDGIVHLWDARLTSEQHRLTGTRNEFVSELVYSTDGRLLGVAAKDRTVSVWDAKFGQEAVTLTGHGRWVSDFAYVGRGDRLATSSWDGTVKIWDIVSGTATATFATPKGSVVAVAASADGRFVAGAIKPKQVLIWDTMTGAVHATFPASTSDFTRLAFAPDNRTLALASAQAGVVPMWDVLEKRALPELRSGEQPFSAIAFNPDGSRLAVGQDIAGSYRIAEGVTAAAIFEWDVKSGQLLRQLRGHIGPIRGLAYRGDGRVLASGSEDATIRIWNSDDGALLQTLSGHTHAVQSVAFSPDGRRLASGAGSPAAVAPEQELKMWDMSTGMETLDLPGHTMGVCAVAFRPDGGQLASASADGTIKLWDAIPAPHPSSNTGLSQSR